METWRKPWVPESGRAQDQLARATGSTGRENTGTCPAEAQKPFGRMGK